MIDLAKDMEDLVIYTNSGFRNELYFPEDLSIDDIAFGLSRCFRWGCQSNWTVAQHCLLGATKALLGGDKVLAYNFLLHDASEAFLCDLPYPIKSVCLEYRVIEEVWVSAIEDRFDCESNAEVKRLDRELLELEVKFVWDIRMYSLDDYRDMFMSVYLSLRGDTSSVFPLVSFFRKFRSTHINKYLGL